MGNARKKLQLFCIVLSVLTVLSGCMPDNYSITPIEESYEYSTDSGYYVRPAAVDGWAEKDALTTTTEDGTFLCFTADTAQADDFINAQRTLLHLLRDNGLETGELESYATDYGFCFSESSDKTAYVALSSVRTWQQVLVTLQAIWGDYTEYGYVYAMSNAIAEKLGWKTDPTPAVEKAALKTFFAENPEAIHLLYPTFTTEFASEETVNSCKALSVALFKKISWRKALKKPIAEQLEEYYALVSDYAEKLSIPFNRQTCGYAYYGEGVKLRIMTNYAELIIDSNYRDDSESLYGDYWSNYSSIYETVNTINREITTAVERFELEDEAGIIRIKWLDSEYSSTEKYIPQNSGAYHPSTQTIYITSIRPYLHEYYHHIEHLINPDLGQCWQSQAFCEIGSSHSQYALLTTESTFSKSEDDIELFRAFTGRAYEPGRDDFFEAMDILCYLSDYYQLAYKNGAQTHNSFSRYLVDLYGEDEVCNLLLFPETVEDITGKTWEELRAEWEQHIREKYADVEIPEA